MEFSPIQPDLIISSDIYIRKRKWLTYNYLRNSPISEWGHIQNSGPGSGRQWITFYLPGLYLRSRYFNTYIDGLSRVQWDHIELFENCINNIKIKKENLLTY